MWIWPTDLTRNTPGTEWAAGRVDRPTAQGPHRPQEQLAPFCTAAGTHWLPKMKVCSKGRAPQCRNSSAYVNPSFREALVGSAFHDTKLIDAEGLK